MTGLHSTQELRGKHILLGVSGGIAAYKSAALSRLLKRQGAEVRVVMTAGAEAFITPLTFQALTGEAVHTSLLDSEAEAGMGHIELARWADLIIIAPGTANLIARLAGGHADDLLTTLCLASQAQRWIAPAMNQQMWAHPAVQNNIAQLRQHGFHIIGPTAGEQACGDIGRGRMTEPEEIIALIGDDLEKGSRESMSASGLNIVITAGPTREALDPVRYISNYSSGKMGYALAAAAQQLGANVTLISGPVQLETPLGVSRISVTSAEEMMQASADVCTKADIFISSAAVADYRSAQVAEQKIKKGKDDVLRLTLIKNPDIVATIAAMDKAPFTIGFAAETQALEEYALDKLERKKLNMIVANQVGNGLAFDQDDNAATLLWKTPEGSVTQQHYGSQPKKQLAYGLLTDIIRQYRIHCPC